MNRRSFLLLPFLALTLVTSAFAGWGDRYKEPFSYTGDFAPGGTVRIENVNGSITVEAWDRNAYAIEGEKRAKHEEDLERIELIVDIRHDHIGLKVDLPKKKGWFNWGNVQGSVNLVLKVPASARLENISTVNGGVEISGLHGNVHASTVNGGIKAYDLAGSARLNTVNGGLSASFTHLDPNADLEMETVNGGVKIYLPHDANAEVRGSVVNGHISTDLPLTIEGKITKRSLRGTLGNGGAHIKASTVNGSVRFVESS